MITRSPILTGGKTVTAELEVVVDRAMNGEKLLGMAGRFEPLHVTFPPSGRLVRDLAAIVEISALPMLNARQDLAFGSAIGAKFIRHDHSGHVAQTFKQLSEEALGGRLVTAALNQYIEHIPVLVDGSPQVMQFASDADKHLVQEPFVTGLWPASLEALGIGPSEAQAPLLAVFSGHGLEVWHGGVGPRQQIIDAGVEMAGDDAVQHISEIGLRIHLAQLAGLDQ